MADFRTTLTQRTEKAALQILKHNGIEAIVNNQKDMTAVDCLLPETGETLDVQFSADFSKYGDIRIDLVSAYSFLADRFGTQQKIRDQSKCHAHEPLPIFLGRFLDIKKLGKIFQQPPPHWLCYLVFDHQIEKNTPTPLKMAFLLETAKVLHWLNWHWTSYGAQGRIKLNDKSALGDQHGSAFIAVPLKDLCKSPGFKLLQTSALFI